MKKTFVATLLFTAVYGIILVAAFTPFAVRRYSPASALLLAVCSLTLLAGCFLVLADGSVYPRGHRVRLGFAIGLLLLFGLAMQATYADTRESLAGRRFIGDPAEDYLISSVFLSALPDLAVLLAIWSLLAPRSPILLGVAVAATVLGRFALGGYLSDGDGLYDYRITVAGMSLGRLLLGIETLVTTGLLILVCSMSIASARVGPPQPDVPSTSPSGQPYAPQAWPLPAPAIQAPHMPPGPPRLDVRTMPDAAIVHVLRQWCHAAQSNDQRAQVDLGPIVRDIGAHLHVRGGVTEMWRIRALVGQDPGPIDAVWSGIGQTRP